MIIDILFILIDRILSALNLIFPPVTLENIWVIGPFVRSTLVLAVGYWNSFLDTFPYAELPWQIFIYFIIWFEIVLMILRGILGARSPIKHVD